MQKILAYITAIVILTSCNNYYKAIIINKPVNSRSIDSLEKENKYFILRDGSQAFAMSKLLITADQKSIECNLDSLPDEHKLYLNNRKKAKMTYRKTAIEEYEIENELLNEVHIYVDTNNTTTIGQYSIIIDKIQKLEVLEKDKQKTKKSHTASAIGFTAAILLLLSSVLFLASLATF